MKPFETTAIALLSSGLDSAVSMAFALDKGIHIKSAITFDYGQRAAIQEIQHAKAISDYFGVSHEVMPLPWFSQFESKGLLSKKDPLAHPSLKTLSDSGAVLKSAAQVWVPNRNGVFLEVAASIAENQKVTTILVGFNAEEAVTFPDNSIAYIEAINKALALSTSNHVRVESPTMEMNKTEIVALGIALNFPFSLLWSCYEEGDVMCGSCESCMRLKRALVNQEKSLDGLFINTILN